MHFDRKQLYAQCIIDDIDNAESVCHCYIWLSNSSKFVLIQSVSSLRTHDSGGFLLSIFLFRKVYSRNFVSHTIDSVFSPIKWNGFMRLDERQRSISDRGYIILYIEWKRKKKENNQEDK